MKTKEFVTCLMWYEQNSQVNALFLLNCLVLSVPLKYTYRSQLTLFFIVSYFSRTRTVPNKMLSLIRVVMNPALFIEEWRSHLQKYIKVSTAEMSLKCKSIVLSSVAWHCYVYRETANEIIWSNYLAEKMTPCKSFKWEKLTENRWRINKIVYSVRPGIYSLVSGTRSNM